MGDKPLEVSLDEWKEILDEVEKIHEALFAPRGFNKNVTLIALLLDSLDPSDDDEDKPWE